MCISISIAYNQANIIREANFALMVVHRLQHWPNNKSILVEHIVLLGRECRHLKKTRRFKLTAQKFQKAVSEYQ